MRIETIFTESAPRIAADCLGAGPVVLFLHGIGGNRTNCRPLRKTIWPWPGTRGYGLSEGYDGALDFADAVRLTRLRGQAMQTAVPLGEGTMAAIIGIRDVVDHLSATTHRRNKQNRVP